MNRVATNKISEALAILISIAVIATAVILPIYTTNSFLENEVVFAQELITLVTENGAQCAAEAVDGIAKRLEDKESVLLLLYPHEYVFDLFFVVDETKALIAIGDIGLVVSGLCSIVDCTELLLELDEFNLSKIL